MRWMMPTALLTLCLIGVPKFLSAAEPIATTDGETSGTRIEVQELKRQSGGTVMLRFTAINDSDQDVPNYLFQATEGSHSVDGIYLIDFAGKKKYEVVRDADKHCICSQNLPTLKPKSSLNLWAKFPAPPDNVDKIGILFPHFAPVDDVPLKKAE